jgi:hypothetical protein
VFVQLGEWFRKLSLIAILVGLLVAFYTEAFSDIPVGRTGRPKGPLSEQRLSYCLVIAAGVPGAAWAIIRTVRGQQRTPWE